MFLLVLWWGLVFLVVFLVACGYFLNNYFHNQNLPDLGPNLFNFSRALVFFPHPDDETISAGGLLLKLLKLKRSQRFEALKVVLVTPGDAGDELVKLDRDELAELRRKETAEVMEFLGITDFEIWDFPDGKLEQDKYLLDMEVKLAEEIEFFKPDLIVGHESAGIYGHPDHIQLAESIMEIAAARKISYLGATMTENLYEISEGRMPKHMAKDFANLKHDLPNYKLKLGLDVVKKFRALKLYKSQRLFRVKPEWLYFIIWGREYYYFIENN